MLIQQKSHRCYEGEKYICVGKLFIKGIVPHTQILPRVLFWNSTIKLSCILTHFESVKNIG